MQNKNNDRAAIKIVLVLLRWQYFLNVLLAVCSLLVCSIKLTLSVIRGTKHTILSANQNKARFFLHFVLFFSPENSSPISLAKIETRNTGIHSFFYQMVCIASVNVKLLCHQYILCHFRGMDTSSAK